MRSTCTLIITIMLLGLLAGCSPGRALVANPETLADVNENLHGRLVTIICADGTTISSVRNVEVNAYTTRYQGRGVDVVPTSQVVRITTRGDSGAGLGFLLGVLPGGIVVGATLLDTDSGYRDLFIGLGIATALVGGITVSLLGDLLSPGQDIVVYQGPVERYVQK